MFDNVLENFGDSSVSEHGGGVVDVRDGVFSLVEFCVEGFEE